MSAIIQVAPAPSAPASWELYSQRQRWGFLAILFLVATSNYFDRNVIAVLLEPIKHEFHVSDTMLGLLGGFCFATFYALFGLPVARWADGGNRRTIITLALTVWSLMTVLCGLAPSFGYLAAARVGVGAGEAGAIPPAQALIADYFPPQQRARAIAVFVAAAMAGYLLGFGVGGSVAATYGWRAAFLLAGVPGLALALLTLFGLDEPRVRLGFPSGNPDRESLGESLRRLKAKRAFIYAVIGCLLYFFIAYGAVIFIPSFLIRVQHVSLGLVSTAYGTAAAVGTVVGTLGGGWLADRLGRRDVRWLAWLPAAACALTGPLYMIAFSVDHFGLFLALGCVASTLLGGGLPTVFAAILAVCGSRRRATAIAIVLFSATLFGGGFGPLVTGAVSDALSATYGAEGLRYSLMSIMPLLLVTGGFFYLFGRAMPADLED
jgi:MFS family permease